MGGFAVVVNRNAVPVVRSVAKLHADDTGVRSVSFNPDGTRMALGCLDGVVRTWHVPEWTELASLATDGTDQIKAVINADARTAAGNTGTDVQLWDLATPDTPGPPLVGHSATIGALAFSPDGHLLLTGDDQGSLHLWQLP